MNAITNEKEGTGKKTVHAIMNLTKKISLLLQLTGASITTFSTKIGATTSGVCAWLNKDCCPSAKYLPSIASFFKVSLNYLFSPDMPRSIEDIPFTDSIYRDAPSEEMLSIDFPNSKSKDEQTTEFALDAMERPAVKNAVKGIVKDVVGDIVKTVVEDNLTVSDDDRNSLELLSVYRKLDKSGQHAVLSVSYAQLDRINKEL